MTEINNKICYYVKKQLRLERVKIAEVNFVEK